MPGPNGKTGGGLASYTVGVQGSLVRMRGKVGKAGGGEEEEEARALRSWVDGLVGGSRKSKAKY